MAKKRKLNSSNPKWNKDIKRKGMEQKNTNKRSERDKSLLLLGINI